MSEAAEREARRALARLRRAVEKAERELDAVAEALARADEAYESAAIAGAAEHLSAVGAIIEEEAERLQARLLRSGGIGPERLRRSGEDEA